MEEAMISRKPARLLKLKADKSRLLLTIEFSKQEGMIQDALLVSQNHPLHNAHSMNYSVQEKSGKVTLTAQIDLAEIDFRDSYWNIDIICLKNGEKTRISPVLDKKMSLLLIFRNFQCIINNDLVFFPMRGKDGVLTFLYRSKSPYDGYGTRLKEFTAFGLYTLFKPYWKKRKIWLVYEKFCSMAQDNGYYFFKYCMEQLPESQKKRIFFILDPKSPDWDKTTPYRSHVIPFMSIRHMIYSLAAGIYIASDSKKHLYAWLPKPNFISNQINQHKILFLQHGVTALKRVDPLFGQHGLTPMTHFAVTSEFEQDIVVKNFGYTPENTPVLGFCRWDVLEDTSTPEERLILVMPTWRSWLEDATPEEFRKSDYYQKYTALLQSSQLKQILAENSTKIIFYIHPKFKDYLSEFNSTCDSVELIPFGTLPLNELLRKCSMLITDYSSVCWEAYYLKKPVLFYQFDCERYKKEHGSYIDMQKELFGERFTESAALISSMEQYIISGFQEKEEYSRKRSHYFAYHDNDNSKRTYEYLVKKGY